MSTLQLARLIGTTVHVRFETITVACVIRDAKTGYGKPRFLVQPIAGCGEQWIEPSRILENVEVAA